MQIRQVTENKKRYLALLLLGDEQESQIDRYLERGTLFVLDDDGVQAVCVVTDEGGGMLEVQNLAVVPDRQRQGLGRTMLAFVERYAQGRWSALRVRTGDSPLTVPFYERCGFRRCGVVKDYFPQHYDHPIYEGGRLLIDQICMEKQLGQPLQTN